FQGHGYTQLNEEIDRAIKDTVARILAALKEDENSIKLNYDYVFYPRQSPELLTPKQVNDWTVGSQPCTANGHVPLLLTEGPVLLPETGAIALPTSNVVGLSDPAAMAPNSSALIECSSDFDDEDVSGSSPAADSPVDRFRGGALQSSVTTLPVDFNTLPQHQLPMAPVLSHVASANNVQPLFHNDLSAFNVPLREHSVTSLSYHSALEEVSPLPTNFCNYPPGSENPLPPGSGVPASNFINHPKSIHEFAGCGATQYPIGLVEGAESLQSYATTQHPSLSYSQRDTEVFITLKVPVYAQSLLTQIANHISSKVRRTPILVVPGDATNPGHVISLPERQSVLCCRAPQRGVAPDGSATHLRDICLLPLPSHHCLIVTQDDSSPVGIRTRVFRPPSFGSIVITPDEELHYVQRPTVVIPSAPSTSLAMQSPNIDRIAPTAMSNQSNGSVRLVEVPMSANDGSLTFDDALSLMMTLRGLPYVTDRGSLKADVAPASHPPTLPTMAAEGTPTAATLADTGYYSLPYGAVPLYATGNFQTPQTTVESRRSAVSVVGTSSLAANSPNLLMHHQTMVPGLTSSAPPASVISPAPGQAAALSVGPRPNRSSLQSMPTQADLPLGPAPSAAYQNPVTGQYGCQVVGGAAASTPPQPALPTQPLAQSQTHPAYMRSQQTALAPPPNRSQPPQVLGSSTAQALVSGIPVAQPQQNSHLVAGAHSAAGTYHISIPASMLSNLPGTAVASVVTSAARLPLHEVHPSISSQAPDSLAALYSNPSLLACLPNGLWTNSPTVSLQNTSTSQWLPPSTGGGGGGGGGVGIVPHQPPAQMPPQQISQTQFAPTGSPIQLPPTAALASLSVQDQHHLNQLLNLQATLLSSQQQQQLQQASTATPPQAPPSQPLGPTVAPSSFVSETGETNQAPSTASGLVPTTTVPRSPASHPSPATLPEAIKSATGSPKFVVTPVAPMTASASSPYPPSPVASKPGPCTAAPVRNASSKVGQLISTPSVVARKFTVVPVESPASSDPVRIQPAVPTEQPTASSTTPARVASKFTVSAVVTEAINSAVLLVNSSQLETDSPARCPPPPCTPSASTRSESPDPQRKRFNELQAVHRDLSLKPSVAGSQQRGDLIQTYRIVRSRECALEFADFLELAGTEHLRGHPFKLRRKLIHMDARQNAFSQKVFGAWNGLPDEVVLS
ncbi:unnamed protein product, partial [Schistocephalus solidus]|uniref:Mediator of RNA polymerase II transcription subunit 13 n=1 Tax=Schistocephalus solidus TaxID=70667 RepID=A0A183SU88_SCHSO